MFPHIFPRELFVFLLFVLLLQLQTLTAFSVGEEQNHILKRQTRQVGSTFGFGVAVDPGFGVAVDPVQADLSEVCKDEKEKRTPVCREFIKEQRIKCRQPENSNLKECEGVDLKINCDQKRWKDRPECTEGTKVITESTPEAGKEAVDCSVKKNKKKRVCGGPGINCNARRNRSKPQCQGENAPSSDRPINCRARKNRNKAECAEANSSPRPNLNCQRRKNRKKPQCVAAAGREEDPAVVAERCSKRKFRRRPECLKLAAAAAAATEEADDDATGGSSTDPDVQENCRGRKNKKKPRCREALMKNKNCKGRRRFTKRCLGTGDVSQALTEIEWIKNLTKDNLTLDLPGLPGTPTGAAVESRFLLAHGQSDIRYYGCRTPRSEEGHCRYLQHCILPEFLQDFRVFLSYVCFIDGAFLGVCCPDSRYPEDPPPITTTTQRPTTTTRPPTPPTERGCGRNSPVKDQQQTRIVGGLRAELNEFPWAAALLRNGDSQYCGGVLISTKHVLTASHCVDGFPLDSVKVRLGDYTFDNDTESRHQDFTLTSILLHEDYSRTTYVNDIALLTLSHEADVNAEVWPVCLPPPGEMFVGEIGTVVGWGTIYYGGPVSSILQKVQLPVWTNEECNAAYPDNEIFEQNLCAGVDEGGKDSCQGDSGGPLLVQLKSTRQWVTIGVVSWGIRCAEPGNPGVYARVNKYLDWIDVHTK